MKTIALMAVLLLSGCAASLKFIDQQTGQVYLGKTGNTMGSSGKAHATIDGENYQGEWIYSPNGGSFTIGSGTAYARGSSGYASASGSSISSTHPVSGNGLITLHGDQGGYVRCVFSFNTSADSGIGQCSSRSGRIFDLMIRR